MSLMLLECSLPISAASIRPPSTQFACVRYPLCMLQGPYTLFLLVFYLFIFFSTSVLTTLHPAMHTEQKALLVHNHLGASWSMHNFVVIVAIHVILLIWALREICWPCHASTHMSEFLSLLITLMIVSMTVLCCMSILDLCLKTLFGLHMVHHYLKGLCTW